MNVFRQKSMRSSRGQSLLETALMMPLMLLVTVNAVNLGYFFFVALNLTSATRTGAEFSMVGPGSPGTTSYPPVCSTCSGVGPNVAALLYNDLTGAVFNAVNANITVCSPSVTGTNGTGNTGGYANCVTCTNSTTCGTAVNGSSGTSHLDPENTTYGFVLNRVQVDYQFTPLVPGTLFNLILVNGAYSNGQYTFHRAIEMRAM
jgi:hypothetical protein